MDLCIIMIFLLLGHSPSHINAALLSDLHPERHPGPRGRLQAGDPAAVCH